MRRLAWIIMLAGVIVAVSVLSGAVSIGRAATATTLRLGYYEDIQSPDPDIQYDIPGLELVNNVYEGLVRYPFGNSTKITPWLATSWKISKNKTVYTFNLRHGVLFHDGTPFNAAAFKFDIERRLALKQGTLYQVQDIKSVSAPSKDVLVITLKHPVSAFLDYLASPYSLKAISPTAIRKHEKGNDWGKAWMNTHDAGTGPYAITHFVYGQEYDLAGWSKWWGAPKAYYKVVQFLLVPDSGTQVLKLQAGDLDILHQQPTTTLDSFRSKSGFQVKVFPQMLKTWIHVNPNKGPFKTPAVRQALASAIDKDLLVKTFFGSYGKVSTQFYPAGQLPPSQARDNAPYDPSKLKAAVSKLPSSDKSVTLTYLSGHGADIQRISEAIRGELAAAGLKVTVREITVSELFSYPAENPTSAKVPDLFVGSENPDSASPDTWARPYASHKAGLNYLAGDLPAADALMNKGLASTDHSTALADYAKAGDLLVKNGTFVTIADVNDTFLARAGITGWQHQIECTTCISLASLRGPAR
jgi:peptide/nickel transport system substrate-binding protein